MSAVHLNAFTTAVASLTHVSCVQTAPRPTEIPFYACVALVSGREIGTVDTLAASTDVVLRGFRVQSRVIDTAGSMSVALARSTRVAVSLIADVKWFRIVERQTFITLTQTINVP